MSSPALVNNHRAELLALEISHAARLRCKLRDAGAGQLVHNVWGVGYAFTKPQTDHAAN